MAGSLVLLCLGLLALGVQQSLALRSEEVPQSSLRQAQNDFRVRAVIQATRQSYLAYERAALGW